MKYDEYIYPIFSNIIIDVNLYPNIIVSSLATFNNTSLLLVKYLNVATDHNMLKVANITKIPCRNTNWHSCTNLVMILVKSLQNLNLHTLQKKN